MDTTASTDPSAMVRQLCDATNAHDLDGIVACFATEYRNETPVHPHRSFTGRDQVRENWAQILSVIPDVHAEVLRTAVDGNTVWSEWEHRGTRPDGSAHLMRGVVIFGVEDGLATWARFYLDPVEDGGDDADQFRRRQLGVDEAS